MTIVKTSKNLAPSQKSCSVLAVETVFMENFPESRFVHAKTFQMKKKYFLGTMLTQSKILRQKVHKVIFHYNSLFSQFLFSNELLSIIYALKKKGGNLMCFPVQELLDLSLNGN